MRSEIMQQMQAEIVQGMCGRDVQVSTPAISGIG